VIAKHVKVGEAVGIIAAQSIGEPGTQLTMRTFHVGGVAISSFKQPEIKAKNSGIVRYHDLRVVATEDSTWVVLNKNGRLAIHDKSGKELESHPIVIGAVIAVADEAKIRAGGRMVTWDPYNVPLISERAGAIEFRDMILGITLGKEVDETTKAEGLVVVEHKEDLHPQIVVADPKTKEVLASYSIPAGARLNVKEGEKIPGGYMVAKTPRKVSKTKDITGGLPRVAELFEARKPKDASEIAKINGVVEIAGMSRGKQKVLVIDPETGEQEEHLVSRSKHLIVYNGDRISKGDQLTEGPVVPHEVLDILGPHELQEHLVNEVQEVYRLQGVEINDKHIEIIVRQMLRKIRITDPGDTEFLWGDQVERVAFELENQKVEDEGGKPAEGEPVLLGITKASLETDSFISAASFQDTTRVLTDAATLGKVDSLNGFKENVIMGHLIPAGTGFRGNRDFELRETVLPKMLQDLEDDGEVDREEAAAAIDSLLENS